LSPNTSLTFPLPQHANLALLCKGEQDRQNILLRLFVYTIGKKWHTLLGVLILKHRSQALVSLENIRQAYKRISPMLKDTPFYQSTRLSDRFGFDVRLKCQFLNPLRSFKGRGAEWWVAQHKDLTKVACVSAGNFGQAMAYVCKINGIELHVFTVDDANEQKVRGIQKLGATVHFCGQDYAHADRLAANYASENSAFLLIDGDAPEITEGAATIGLELTEATSEIYIPIGDGALINGIGSWMKQVSPKTKVIGVCAAGAPAMYESWKQGKVIRERGKGTIADGIAILEPVASSFDTVRTVVDEILWSRTETLKMH